MNESTLPRLPEKCRVTLLALGDVGSTLLLGLRLLGGDVIRSIGICDVRPGAAERWEFELNQIQSPDGAVMPPVDPLCRAALRESGLAPAQVRGFGLGVMHARAMYYAGKDGRFASYLTEGRAFGPHGEDLVLANSIEHYDDALSRELTEKVAHANLEMRRLGYKPYAAPALSSGALSLLCLLRGEWHYSSVFDGRVFMGCRNRLTPEGIEVEQLTLPHALQRRIDETRARLDAIQ